MSYLGRKPIKIPEHVNIKMAGNSLLVEGPLGSWKRKVDSRILFEINETNLTIQKPVEKKDLPLWGLYRKLISNMVTGVSMGFSTQLEIIGVGYKAEVKTTNEGSLLLLKLGFSHPISLKVPVGIDVSVVKTSKNSLLVFSGINNELINSFASKVRDYRRPEPYKGKGLSYLGEQVRRKEGKKK